MPIEIARKAVDYILGKREVFCERDVVWNFIGGEPFLEAELIEEIMDYIKYQMYAQEHPWFDHYRFSFSTNGLLYDSPTVQRLLLDNGEHISVGISIDGNRLKHDMTRPMVDGSGSYEKIIDNVRLWMKQFPLAQTKSTWGSEDLPHLRESIIALWDIGIRNVAANVVFEDVWQEGDADILYEQLRALADYSIDNDLYHTYNCSFFVDTIGKPVDCRENGNWCGAGKMLAIDYDGRFYPCTRFVPFSMMNVSNKRCEITNRMVGDVDAGYDFDKLRPFYSLTRHSQSSAECFECPVGSGCAWCQGFNLENSQTDTIFERAAYICEMHKARVKAAEYYYRKLKEKTGIERTRTPRA
jgi:radical SAM peptide maturase (CXXX-repeat target family)